MRRMIGDDQTTQPKEPSVKSYVLSETDAMQVRALLLAAAENSDHHAVHNEALRGRMTEGLKTSEDPTDDQETIADLVEIHEEFTADTTNLQRIAKIFE